MPKRSYIPWSLQNWDEGYIYKGRMEVYLPDYPYSVSYGHKKGYITRAAAVWWIYTGQKITRGWVIHHIDENKLNDCIDNLQVMTANAHASLHHFKDIVYLTCEWCGSEFRVYPYRKKTARYCSSQCKGEAFGLSKKGKKKSLEQIEKQIISAKRAHAEGKYPRDNRNRGD